LEVQVQVQVKNFVVPPLLKERRCITIVTSKIICS